MTTNPATAAYRNVLRNAAAQSQQIARSGQRVRPVFFFIDQTGQVSFVGWRGAQRPYEAVDEVRALAAQHHAVAFAYITEAYAAHTDSADIFDTALDSIVLTGYCPADTPSPEAYVWSLDADRNAHPATNATIPDQLTGWMSDVL